MHLSCTPSPLVLAMNSHFSYLNLSLFTAFWPSDSLSILEGTFNFTLKNLLTSTIEGSRSKSATQFRVLRIFPWRTSVSNTKKNSTLYQQCWNQSRAYTHSLWWEQQTDETFVSLGVHIGSKITTITFNCSNNIIFFLKNILKYFKDFESYLQNKRCLLCSYMFAVPPHGTFK